MRAVNLLPLDQRGGSARGAGRSQGGAYAVLVLLTGLALLAVVYGVARHQVTSRQAKAVALEAQVQRVQSDVASLAPYTSFIALREQRVQTISQLVNSRFDWAHAFHELGRVLPPNVSVTSLSGTIGAAGGSTSSAAAPASRGGTVASATPAGSVPSFTLSGCAKTQSTVALTLERLRLMDGVTTVTLVSSSKAGGSAGASGSGTCPSSYPVFNVQVTFAALPASSATSIPPEGAPVSSTSAGVAKPASTGGIR